MTAWFTFPEPLIKVLMVWTIEGIAKLQHICTLFGVGVRFSPLSSTFCFKVYPWEWLHKFGWILLVVSGGELLLWSTLFCTHGFWITLFKLLCHRCLTTTEGSSSRVSSIRRSLAVHFAQRFTFTFSRSWETLSMCDIYCLSLLINSW